MGEVFFLKKFRLRMIDNLCLEETLSCGPPQKKATTTVCRVLDLAVERRDLPLLHLTHRIIAAGK
jgi:hypothetical protein